MADKAAVAALIAELTGRRTGYRYADLARVLAAAGCMDLGSKGGSHRSWHYPGLKTIVTLKDDGSRELTPGYIKLTRKYLKDILETL